jgi:hypothetical protein
MQITMDFKVIFSQLAQKYFGNNANKGARYRVEIRSCFQLCRMLEHDHHHTFVHTSYDLLQTPEPIKELLQSPANTCKLLSQSKNPYSLLQTPDPKELQPTTSNCKLLSQ